MLNVLPALLWMFASSLLCVQGNRYVVTTYTGDRFGAGTDARVFIKLYGTKGDTADKELEAQGRDNFERGQLDTFVLDAKDIGVIKKAQIRHDNSWLGPGWFLEKVTVTKDNGDYYEFPVHKWFDKHQDDHKLSRNILPMHKKDEIAETETSDQDKPEPRQPLDCSWPQGIGDGKLGDEQFTASTSFNDLHLPYHARLGQIAPNSLGGWCPYKNEKDEYLQFDLEKVKRIAGVATQGLGLVDEWTTSYRILYSNKSDEDFREYSETGTFPKYFLGNADQNGTVLHWLRMPFFSRYVRLSPFKWHGKGCLRAEMYGCPTAAEKPTAPTITENDLAQAPEHQNIDDTSSYPLEEHHGQEESSLVPSKETGEVQPVTGEKHDEVPIKKTPPLVNDLKLVKDDQPIKLLQLESNKDPTTSIDITPIVHLDFDEIKDQTVPDVSGHHNDAHLRPPVDIRMFSKACERGVRMNGGDVYFDGEFFVDKPRSEVTIAAWIKLFSNGGQHTIFSTVGGKNSAHRSGQYHLEVDRGKLRWYHRNEANQGMFNVSSPLMIPAHAWTHCAATYSSLTGKASVFINAKLAASGFGTGILSQDWTGRAGIGQQKGDKVLNGEIDEFYIFNKALAVQKIQTLMKRCSFETDCQRSLGMQSKEILDSQITASSTYNLHKPYYGRINLASFGGDPARTAWCAVKDDRSPFFEIQLAEMTSLTGVATQGLSLFDNWVTSYLFCYSSDKEFWDCYKEKGYDKVFEANTDKNSIKRHHFHHTVDAKFVRIRPQSWYGNHLCMRVEIYGCIMDLLPDSFDSFGNPTIFMEDTEAQTRNEITPKESCNKPLGLSNGEIDDNHVTASSSLDEHDQSFNGRLVRESIDQSDIRGCWCARDVNLRQYIEADLGEVKTVTGIATQGYVSHDNWVVSYRLGLSDDTNALEWYREEDDEKLFEANKDRSSIVKHYLKKPMKARYVRLNPRAWHGIHICMRFEVFGCKEDAPLNIANVVLVDETKELAEPLEHHVTSNGDEPTTKGESDGGGSSITKLSTEEENADNKQYIPTKSLLRQEEFASQVKSHVHRHSQRKHEVKRLKPGHGTAREMLEVTYPSPMLPVKSHSHGKSLKIGPGKKPIGAPSLLRNHKNKKPNEEQQEPSPLPPIILGKEAKEEAMLKVVDKLQTLSDDKLAAEMKGPILALAKQKIIEDLMSFKNSPRKTAKDRNNNKALCARDGHCFNGGEHTDKEKPPVDTNIQMLNDFVKKLQEPTISQQHPSSGLSVSVPKPIISNAVPDSATPSILGPLFIQPNPDAVSTHSGFLHQQQQQQQQQEPFPSFLQQQFNPQIPPVLSAYSSQPLQQIQPQPHSQQQQQQQQPQQPQENWLPNFNAEAILERYPELRNSGLTSGSLARLAMRVPNLEERIRKHFANKRHIKEVAERNKEINEKNIEIKEKNIEINEKNSKMFSSHDFMKQFKEYLDGPTKSEVGINKPSEFIASSFEKPPGIDSRPCRRDGSCFFPEPLYHKAPHSMAPKPDVWIKDAFLVPTGFKDDTRLTPDHLMPVGPDPRHQDYYTSYMQGHPGMVYQPPPPPPPPPHPQPMQMIDMQTVVEHGPPSIYPPPQPPPHPQPMQMIDMQTVVEHGPPFIYPPPQPQFQPPSVNQPSIDMQTTVENLPPGATIESTTTLEPPFPHGGLYQWTPFSVCSVTCGQGEKKRFRRCERQDCPVGGVEIETATCIEPSCPEVDPYNWSQFTACSTTCGVGLSSRYRLCSQGNCASDGYETQQVPCYQPNCPVCLIDFEVVNNHVAIDQSGNGNHGYFNRQILIREHPQICGHFADLTNLGEIVFPGETFYNKPKTGVTIACWVNIQSEVSGKHSIFSTIRRGPDGNFIGGYHLEVDSGSVRWFHRDAQNRIVFSMMTSKVVIPRVWMHFTGVYDGFKGIARVFIDGKEQGSNIGNGELSQDWGYKASIGYYDFDDRRINGWVDEFLMYDYALDEDQIFALLGKMRCPTGNSTSVEIDAFRFESIMTVNLKRSVIDDDVINGTSLSKKTGEKDENFVSRINTKHKQKKTDKDKRDIKEINDSGLNILSVMKNIKDRIFPKTYIREINSTTNNYNEFVSRRGSFGWKHLPNQRTLRYTKSTKKKKRRLKKVRKPHR